MSYLFESNCFSLSVAATRFLDPFLEHLSTKLSPLRGY